MGWDSRMAHYGETVDFAEEVRQRYTWSGNKAIKVVRGKRQHGVTPYYVAVQKDDGSVWAGVALTQRRGDEVAMKVMSEDEGPGYAEAVAGKILPLLTSTDSKWANEWREKVAQVVIAEKAKPKVKAGDVLKFEKPMEFTYGGEQDTLIWVEKNVFKGFYQNRKFKIPNWKLREFKVLSPEEVQILKDKFVEAFGISVEAYRA
jgi:hypothetical protein